MHRDVERHEEAQRGADGHRERCSGIGSVDVEVVLGTSADVVSFMFLQCLWHGEMGRGTKRHGKMRRGAERHREAQTDTEREAEVWKSADARFALGTSADVDCVLSLQWSGQELYTFPGA